MLSHFGGPSSLGHLVFITCGGSLGKTAGQEKSLKGRERDSLWCSQSLQREQEDRREGGCLEVNLCKAEKETKEIIEPGAGI